MSAKRHAGRTTPVIGWRDGVPIIAAAAVGDQLRFWCEHCGAMHVHGGGDGFRMARCSDSGSPLRRTGYILKSYAPDVPPRAA
jgi:hypothetical protein